MILVFLWDRDDNAFLKSTGTFLLEIMGLKNDSLCFLLKGALDKYNIYLFIPNSIENFNSN